MSTLTHELLHAIQDHLGMLNNESRTNIEFQVHLLQDIISTISGLAPNSTVAEKESGGYGVWLTDLINTDDTFNREVFDSKRESYLKSFMKLYSK